MPLYGPHTFFKDKQVTADGSEEITSFPLDQTSAMVFLLRVTAAANTTDDKLNIYLQHSVDGNQWDDFAAFTQVAGDASTPVEELVIVNFAAGVEDEVRSLSDGSLTAGTALQGPVGKYWRVKWDITDVSAPDFTFTLKANSWEDAL